MDLTETTIEYHPDSSEESMKGKVVTVVVAVLAIALLVSCGTVKSRLPGPLTEAERAVGDVEGARVELLESSLGEGLGPGGYHGYSGVLFEISGTARYIPAKVAPRPFTELGCPTISVDLLDALGRKVTEVHGRTTCGEYDEPENVVPNEPFPFHAGFDVHKEEWAKIVSHRVAGFGW